MAETIKIGYQTLGGSESTAYVDSKTGVGED